MLSKSVTDRFYLRELAVVVLLLLLALLALLLEVRAQRFCPGRKPPFWTVKRPARAYKSAMHSRFTMENTKCA
jgi:hypothetical protein